MEIEQTFVRQRGRHMLLGPTDWALIEGWKTQGVPLHVVLRSMELVFERHCRTRSKRSINSLSYYANEVAAQYNEWLASQTGRSAAPTDPGLESETSEQCLPFPRAIILKHVADCRAAVQNLLAALAPDAGPTETLRRVNANLEKAEINFGRAVAPDCGELESALLTMEEQISQAALAHVPQNDLATWRAEAELQLTTYRGRMQPDVYEQTVTDLIHRRVRESIGLRRFSLFSL